MVDIGAAPLSARHRPGCTPQSRARQRADARKRPHPLLAISPRAPMLPMPINARRRQPSLRYSDRGSRTYHPFLLSNADADPLRWLNQRQYNVDMP